MTNAANCFAVVDPMFMKKSNNNNKIFISNNLLI